MLEFKQTRTDLGMRCLSFRLWSLLCLPSYVKQQLKRVCQSQISAFAYLCQGYHSQIVAVYLTIDIDLECTPIRRPRLPTSG